MELRKFKYNQIVSKFDLLFYNSVADSLSFHNDILFLSFSQKKIFNFQHKSFFLIQWAPFTVNGFEEKIIKILF